MDTEPPEIPEGYELDHVGTRSAPDACDWCGKALDDTGLGRPRRYCSRSCRQRAYELRAAQRRYETDAAAGRARDRSAPVSRTLTRTYYLSPMRPPPPPSEGGPLRARAVQADLERVAEAIRSGELKSHDHGRIWRGVAAVLRALDAHHPGGLNNLR